MDRSGLALSPRRRLFGVGLGSALPLLLGLSACSPGDAPGRGESWSGGESGSLLYRLLVVQDRRDVGPEGRSVLARALKDRDEHLRLLAVRAVGRMETPSVLPMLAAALGDPLSPRVRAEAAHAVAQAVFRGPAAEAFPLIETRWAVEEHPVVRGGLARSLGRLPYETESELDSAEEVLAAGWGSAGLDPREELGFVRGAAGLALRRRGLGLPASDRLTAILAGAVVVEEADPPGPEAGGSEAAARIRRAAMDGLVRSGTVDGSMLRMLRLDADPDVRRLTATGAQALLPLAAASLLDSLLDDPDRQVRLAALTSLASLAGTGEGPCEAIAKALEDPWVHVRIQALRMVSRAGECPTAVRGALVTRVRDVASSSTEWVEASAALETLAQVDPDRARALLPRAAADPRWPVRMHAVAPAAELGDVGVLESLADDDHHNVREAALRGLFARVGRGADPYLVRGLDTRDPQLVITASGLLEGTDRREAAVPALVEALGRMTELHGETSRDARLAILARLGELGGEDLVPSLEPYLEDFDSPIAREAARWISEWSDESVAAHAVPLSHVDRVPTPGQLRAYRDARVVLEMESGPPLVIALWPDLAPTNVHRFVRLAASGALDGLTLHRVVPNFVVQGGSPGANEYWGWGDFTRDEVGIPGNLRGTVGLSTRGRDTGDGQFYVNLVDNLRLDDTYTVFGRVVEGLEGADEMVEAAVIRRARVEEGVPEGP